MQICNNVLSDYLFEYCSLEISGKIREPVWRSSGPYWSGSVKEGVIGSCISAFVSDNAKDMIVNEISSKLPPAEEYIIQYYVWQELASICFHHDLKFKFGATIYLNEEWNPNHGGIFIWEGEDFENTGIYNAIAPKKNMMIVNNNQQKHMVTPVSPLCDKYRHTIQIWGN